MENTTTQKTLKFQEIKKRSKKGEKLDVSLKKGVQVYVYFENGLFTFTKKEYTVRTKKWDIIEYELGRMLRQA
tara:strand:+ start:529 stop:747 length:219 start_codon:yes stop_codon:yes gene_type:complete